MRRSYQPKTFKVELIQAAKIPMSAIGQVIRGQESEDSLEAVRVLDIILRQHSAKQYVLIYLHGILYAIYNHCDNFFSRLAGVVL